GSGVAHDPSTVATGRSEGSRRKLPASSCARKRASTRARNSGLPRQAWSRYSARSRGTFRSRASQKIARSSEDCGLALGPFLSANALPSHAPFAASVRHRFTNFSESALRRIARRAQFVIEPGPRESPGAVGGPFGDAQGDGGLVQRQPPKEAELDQLGTQGV